MGFFEKSERVMLPAGTYYGTVISLSIESQPDYNDPNSMTQRAKWTYQMTAKNPETGEPYKYTDWTGLKYGNPKATLTGRLDQMFPKLKPDQKAELSPEEIIGKKFQIEIVHGPNEKGEIRDKIAFLKPYVKAGEPEPTPAEVIATDPFADE